MKVVCGIVLMVSKPSPTDHEYGVVVVVIVIVHDRVRHIRKTLAVVEIFRLLLVNSHVCSVVMRAPLYQFQLEPSRDVDDYGRQNNRNDIYANLE